MKRYLFLIGTLLIAFTSCKKDEPVEDIVPTSYSCDEENYCFTRNGELTVDYSGQIARLNQLSEITSYLKSANTPGTALDEIQLLEMFTNNNGNGSSYFSEEASVPGKTLIDKCFLPYVDYYEGLFAEIASISQNIQAAQDGVAGHMASTTDPSKVYLLDANGTEITQLIEKGLMGDVFLYQANHTYLAGTLDGAYDNSSIVDADAGKHYTEAEHKFDEAFGYFGVPTNFPENTTGLRFHGKYANDRNTALNTNDIMNAFIDARTQITNQEDPAASINEIQLHWSRVCAGTAIHYLKEADANYDDQAIRSHVLSEAWAFIGNLVHAAPFGLSAEEVSDVHAILGTNFYQITPAQIDEAILYLIDRTSIELAEIAEL